MKNIVFDVGNVITRWAPEEILKLSFGSAIDSGELIDTVFHTDIWLNLNKGLLSEQEAASQYRETLNWSREDCQRFFYYVKASQVLIYGTVDLMKRAKQSGYGVYGLTDNVHEIVKHLKSKFDFWPLFDGVTVSAEVGLLKPQPEIYQSLFSTHGLIPSESIFIDDMPHNVKGAQEVGMQAIQFINAGQCESELTALGVNLK